MSRKRKEENSIRLFVTLPESVVNMVRRFCADKTVSGDHEVTEAEVLFTALLRYMSTEGYHIQEEDRRKRELPEGDLFQKVG